jgi:hypothetical protein
MQFQVSFFYKFSVQIVYPICWAYQCIIVIIILLQFGRCLYKFFVILNILDIILFRWFIFHVNNVSGIFRSARHGRVLRRCCRRSQTAVRYIRHRQKQTGFDCPAGRLPLRSSTIRRRPLRSSPVCRCPVRSR